MRYGLLFLLIFSHSAIAEEISCNEIIPHKEPAYSIEICTELLTLDSLATEDRAEALEIRGIAFRELGEYDNSIRDIGASLALSENTSTMRMLAWTYRQAGRLVDAEKLYTRVLQHDTHWQGWLSRCVVRLDLQRNQDALSDCTEALRQNHENLDALHFTARSLSFLDRPKESLPLTITAMKLAPDDPRHLTEHVWALHQLGQTRTAREKALKGLEQFPEDASLLHFLNESQQ